MREIKFRCWDKTNNRMFPPVDAWGFGEGPETFFDNTLCIYKDEVVLQQYTGLKDKNGVEIYEGDVILWEEGWAYPEMNGEIKWVENGYYFLVPEQNVGWLVTKKSLQSAKIIGNIFEGVENERD